MREMTEVQRQRVHPLRGDDVNLPAAADEGRQRIATYWKRAGEFWRRGVKHASAPHGERMKTIVTELDGPAASDGARGARDPETEASLMVMLDYWSRRDFHEFEGEANERYAPVDEWFVRRWLAAGGLPFALRVVEAFPRFEFDAARAGTAATHTLGIKHRDDYVWWCLDIGHLGVFHTLRRFVVASSAADYAAARTEAVRIRETAPIWLRSAIAFAFPDEPFYDQDLAAMRGRSKKLPVATWGLVTTRLGDHAALAAILESMTGDGQSWTTETEYYGFSLARRLGEDAAPLLVGYLDRVRGKTAKLAFAEALALLDSPIAKEFFERKQPNKELQAVASGYLGTTGSKPASKPKPPSKPKPSKPKK